MMADAKRAAGTHSAELPSQEQQETTLHNTTKSPLLHLPAEVRNQIYGYVLGGEIWYIDPSRWGKKKSLSLLLVCRQIYKETAILVFSLTIFWAREERHLGAFILQLSPARRNAIKAIQLGEVGFSVSSYNHWKRENLEEIAHLSMLKGLQTVFIEVICRAPWFSQEEQDEATRKLAEVVKSWKAGITVMVGDYGEDVALAVKY